MFYFKSVNCNYVKVGKLISRISQIPRNTQMASLLINFSHEMLPENKISLIKNVCAIYYVMGMGT